MNAYVDTFLLCSVFTSVKKKKNPHTDFKERNSHRQNRTSSNLVWKNHNYSQYAPNQERINYVTQRKGITSNNSTMEKSLLHLAVLHYIPHAMQKCC